MIFVSGFVLEDRARWAELWRGYFDFYQTSVPDEQYDLTWQKLFDGRLRGFAARDGQGALVGIAHTLTHEHAWAATPALYLQDLFVDPAARGLGAGRALLDAVIFYGKSVSSSRIYWSTNQDNATARRLYDQVASFQGTIRYEVPL